MIAGQRKFKSISAYFFILLPILMMADFLVPGKNIESSVVRVKSELQQYYNAARNSHFTYKIVAEQHEFLVSAEFAKGVHKNDSIQYSVSQVFKEINWFKLASQKSKSYYSLRVVTGLVLPLFALVFMLIMYLTKRERATVFFVVQAGLIACFIYLLVW